MRLHRDSNKKESQIFIEDIDQLSKSSDMAFLSNLLGSLILGGFLFQGGMPSGFWIFFIILNSSMFFRTMVSRQYLEKRNAGIQPGIKWYYLTLAGIVSSSTIWGACGFYFFPGLDANVIRLLVYFLLFSTVSSTGALLNAVTQTTSLAYILPVIGPLVLKLLSQHQIQGMSIALILVFYSAILLVLSRRIRDGRHSTYRLLEGNTKLVAELIKARDDATHNNTLLKKEIEDREKTEVALKASEGRFQTFTDHMSIGVAITVGDRFVYVNNAYCQIFGYTREEIIEEKQPIDLVHPDDWSLVEALVRARIFLQDTSQHYEFTGIRKDGQRIYLEIFASMVEIEGMISNITTLTDITDRKVMQEALRESEEQFRGMFYKHSAVMLLVDPVTGEIFDFNDQAAMFYGFSQRSRGLRNIHEITLSGKIPGIPGKNKRYTGVEVQRHRVARDEIRYVEVHSAPISVKDRDLDFRIIHDVSDRVEFEREREELIHDLEAFGHTVSHNLRNSLNVIIGRASLLRTYPVIKENANLLRTISTIERSGKRMDEIMGALLIFATVKHSEINAELIHMEETILAAIERLSDLIAKENASINLEEVWPDAVGYAPWIEEVWFNYIANAIKYGGKSPAIKLGYQRLTNGYLKFYVQDKGPGIKIEYMSRLFTPFTRLEEGVRGGHGLGLSIVKRIVEKLNGSVGVENLDSGGARFYFTLPEKKTGA